MGDQYAPLSGSFLDWQNTQYGNSMNNNQSYGYDFMRNNTNNKAPTSWMESLFSKDTMLGKEGSAGAIGLTMQGVNSFLNWNNGKDMKQLGRDQLDASNKFNTINVNNSAISYDAQAQQQWETRNAHRANSGLAPLPEPEKMQRLS